MATSPTKTIKISQTIMLDIDFSKIDSVRIVDVDLLILLKDGQRLIVPEGAVRAMMDNEFSINFKGRLFSVAALMELQTFQSMRVTEVGIASKPALPETSVDPVARDVQRLDLSGDLGDETRQQSQTPPEPTSQVSVAQVPSPVKASTEVDDQARQTASTLDRQAAGTAYPPVSSAPMPGALERSSAAALASTLTQSDKAALVTPADNVASSATPGLSSIWKYAVGVLGAGLVAVAGRVGAKVSDAVAASLNQNQTALSDISLTGVLALGPYQEGTKLNVLVRGLDAKGNSIDLTSTTMTVGANSKYSLKLDSAYKNYTGPIMLVFRDGDPQNLGDYRDEATGQLLNMGSLTLRAVGNIKTSGETSINVTPLTELAVRVAQAGTKDSQLVPSQASITQANTDVAKAFGLGTLQDVTTATVKTIFDNSFDPTDSGVGTKYALVLAALSGVDSLQQEGSAAANVEATLKEYAAHFSTTTSTSSTLSQALIGKLLEGAMVAQPTVLGTAGTTTLNVAALLARQIVETVNSTSQTKTLALVTSSVTALGAKGTTVEFFFDKAVNSFKASDVSFSDPRYSLTAFTQLDATGTHWSATLVPPANATGSVSISFNNANWNGNSWTWGVDLIAPSSPESIMLLPATATSPASDSGVSDTDQISQVKTPTVRIKLSADAVAGDVVTVRQIDKSTGNPILGADSKPRNVVNKVITAKEVGTGTVDMTLGDIGTDGEYRLEVSQQDAAGNVSMVESRNYLAYTLDTVAPLAPDLYNVMNGAINFGSQTPLGLVNAATKQAGFVLKGSGEAGCMISMTWGNTLLTTLVNQQGEWSLSLDDSKVPADNTNSQLTLTQADAAGNVSKARTYKVEIATAGVTAKVASIAVSDDSSDTAAGAYSSNASGVMAVGMSTDDNTPMVTVKLDRPLYNNEIIEVYDGVRTAQSTPLFTLSGDYAAIQDKLYAWTFQTSNWPAAKVLTAGTHRFTARVVNTYTLDVGADTDVDSAATSFVVQTLDFNQLLVPTGEGDLVNLIHPGKSAGAESIASTPSNTPKLGGTLTAALGAGERLGVYDGEQYLGEATLTPVSDRTSPYAYTWEYQITQSLKNGVHDLSVRLETNTSIPVVRLAMSQDMTISLPVLRIEGTVDLNGTLVANDTGWFSTDGYSNNRTPTLTLTLPVGYQVGDRITVMGTSSAAPPSAPPIELASYDLTQADLDNGFALITTHALGNTGQANRVWRLWATFDNTLGGVQVSNTAPVTYELDTTQPDLPEAAQMSLKNDTSKGFFTTQTGQLNAINFDDTLYRLQYKIDKDGKTLQDWNNTPQGFELDVGASSFKWGDGKYTISARLVDRAGNFKPVSAGSALGAGNGYINFLLDTTKPLALTTPTLQVDTSNNLPANTSDKVTSNFMLADPAPRVETGATLQYSVTAPGSSASTVMWYGTYLEAMGAANGLNGDALTTWMRLAGSTNSLAEAAAQLKEGVYVVARRQIDKAGNESPQASLSFKLNTMATPITAALSNDTSAGQKVSSDVTVGVSGVDGTAGTDVVLTYTLTRYSDATRALNKQMGSSIITNVTANNLYKPPTADGFYTLVVREVNKAGLVSTSTLNFELDTTNPLGPGAITLDASSNSARQAFDGDTAGTTDTVSTSTAPTFNVVLPSGARVGDRLKLFLNGDVAKPWGEVVLTAEHLKFVTVTVPLNPLPTKNDDGFTPLDGTYIFKARLFDAAGNASDWSPAFTYTQDTQVPTPDVVGLALPGLPPNFINRRDDVTFSGTGEPGSYLTLTWNSKDGDGVEQVKTFHTEVTNRGTWALTVAKADFPVDTVRLGYDSSVTVSQIDPSGNVSGVSNALKVALNSQAQTITATITGITDQNQSNVASGTPLANDYYAINPTGVVIANGQTTDEHKPLLFGTLSAAFPVLIIGDGVPSNLMEVKVFDGETYLGKAIIDSTNAQKWFYQVPSALADGLHQFRVEVYDPLTLQTSAASPIYSINSNVLTLTPLDTAPAHRDNWVITTTSKPVFQGTLKALLAVDEVVAVYDSLDGITWSLLGTVDSSKMQLVSGSYQWSFDTPRAMFGQHTYRVQIEQRIPGKPPQPLLAIDQAVKFDFNSLTLDPSSDSGNSNVDNLSNVATPTLLLHLATNAMAGDVVVLRVQGNNVNLTLAGELTPRSTYTLTQADILAGVVSLAPPNLYQMLNAQGNLSRDGTFTLSATVGGSRVVSDLNYRLDTTAPTYTPVAAIQNLTGIDLSALTNTGFTSDKTLVSRSSVGNDRTVFEQVQVVQADQPHLIVKDWLSLADFNATALADGRYTLLTRMVDTAGNVGRSGADIELQLDTQAATLSPPMPAVTAAATPALQADARLNQREVGATLQFKLEFTEKIKGLTLSHLQLVVSGAANTLPMLESVLPQALDANGYASVWMVKVKDLNNMTDAETLTLKMLNGLGLVDQAGNQNVGLSFTTTPLTVDLTAGFSVNSVQTLTELNPGEGLRELLIGGASSFTINGKVQQSGVRITGATVGVEAGQTVEVLLMGKDSEGNLVAIGDPARVPVLADHTWVLDLDSTTLNRVLADKTDYTLKVAIQDQAGNTATGTVLVLKARLLASIEVNSVEANSLTTSGEDGTVLDFSDTAAADRYVNLEDRRNGSLEAIDPASTGFTVRGSSNIGVGRLVTVTLSKVGVSMVPVIETGTVQSNGSWSVHFSSGAVGNLTDGSWQLKATGTDADGNVATGNELSQPIFTVDTSATVTLNPLGASNNNQINLSLDGDTLTVSGTFADIDAGNSLTLSLRDKLATDTDKVIQSWTLAYNDLTLHTAHGVTTWSHQLRLSDLDGLTLAHGPLLSQAELARLSLTASSSDAAGNRPGVAVVFEMDRTRPITPILGTAIRQIAGSTLEDGSSTSLKSTTTLQVADRGVAIVPDPAAPTSQDITAIRVDAVNFMQGADQWRLGETRWSMDDAALGQKTALLGSALNTVAVSFAQTVDSDGKGHLIIRNINDGVFTPQEVQTVLKSLFWVNTSLDANLSQVDRKFVITYIDALGNLSDPGTLNFYVDTLAPSSLSDVTITPIGEVVVADTLNTTSTSMEFRATIGKGQATNGRSDFYVGSTLIGTDTSISDSDESVTLSLNTATNLALQSAIPTGGRVSVKLYDPAGNMISAVGNELQYDVVEPTITRITSSTNNGTYKAGSRIQLRLETSENMSDGSTLVLTLNTGHAVPGDSSYVANQQVTLTRDGNIRNLFLGDYIVVDGDTSADLAVIDAVNGGVIPRDAAGNALNTGLSGQVLVNTLAGSKDIVIDTTPPTAPTAVTAKGDDGTVVLNTLNSTNTRMVFDAAITAAEATDGKAEFYFTSLAGLTTLIGTDDSITSSDTAVTFTTASSFAAALRTLISAGGFVSVNLYDKAGNATPSSWVSNATLSYDVTPPVLNSVTLSAKRGVVDLASGRALKAEDVVTVTATYDDTVFGSPATAPTLTIGTETGIVLTAVTTSGNTRTWRYTLSDSGTTDTGSISVVANFTAGLTDLAANPATGSPNTTHSYTADTTAPLLNSVVLSAQRGGADLASGSVLKALDVVTVTANYDGAVFGSPTIAPTLTIGTETGVALTAGTTSGNTRTWTYILSDSGTTDTGDISVVGNLTAGVTDLADNTATGTPSTQNHYSADTTAPILMSVTFIAQRGGADLTSGSFLKAGDVVTVTAAYNDTVMGDPTAAPTLTIGTESGIVLTASNSTASTRSWSYTISDSGITDTGSISLVGSLTAGVTDLVGNTATGTPSTTNSYTADTTVTAPEVSLASSSDTGGSSTDRILNASVAIVLNGTAEKNATVMVKQGASTVGTAISSSADGSWSLTVIPRVVVSGLMADSITASAANGIYTLLTAAEVAALSAFSNDFSPTTGVATLIDIAKPVYQWVNGSQTWYLWARQDSGYHISQVSSTSEWYWESSNSNTFAAAPESVGAGAWVRSNVPATTVRDVGDPLNAIAQSGVTINNLSGQGEHTYTVTQIDQAGNDSAGLGAGGAGSMTFTVDATAPSAPALGSAQQNGVNASTAIGGIALFETLMVPVTSDIQWVKIVLGGAGLETAKDQLTIAGTDYSLSNTIHLTSGNIFGVAPNSVSGVDWSYDSASNTLLFKTHSGAALPASDWFTVLASLRFKTTLDAKQGDRTFTLTYFNVAGNASASRTQIITDDSIVPNLDLDTSQAGNNYSSRISQVATHIALASAVSVSDATITEANSIGKITLTASNIVDSNEILVVGNTLLAINGSGATSVNVTVNGQVWTGSYAASGSNHVWTFTNSTSNSSADAQALVRALFYRNNSVDVNLITGSDRGFSLVLTDRSNNDSIAAVTTLQMPDLVAPALDLNTAVAGVNNTQTVLTGFGVARALASANASLVESSDAIGQLRLVVSDILNGVNEKLQVGSTTINADGSTPPASVSVGGLVWNLSVDSANHAFNFTPGSGTSQTAANTLALIQAIQYLNNAATPSDGARSFSFTLTDLALNVSATAVASLVLNAARPFGINKNGSAITPVLAEAVDDNGDGVKGDVNYLYFSEPVKVSAIVPSNLVLSGGATWGTGTVEAVTPLLLGGDAYASKFKITKGTSSMTTSTTLTLNLANVIDQGGSTATANVVFTLPDIVAPTSSVSPPQTISVDNQVSSSESAAGVGMVFTFTAGADNAFIRYYLDGTELKSKRAAIPTNSTAAMTLNMAAADWGAAGVKGLSARLEDANGNLGPASVAKSVNYDPSVNNTATLSMTSNAGPSNSTVDAGDVVQFRFAEAVNLTASMLPSGLLGTTAPTPMADDSFTLSGTVYAKNWTVTLAAGATLGSNLSTPFNLTNVLDTAGNTGNVTVSPSAMVTSPGAGLPLLINPTVKYIGNVATDNVVNAAESATGVAISFKTTDAQVGDNVRLYMDGQLVQTITLSALNFNSSTQTATLNLAATDWGASGTRVLAADITRASYTSGLSNQRIVYVATDATHWSSASLGSAGLWFDPNSLMQDSGTSVTALSALNRPTPLTLANMSGATGPRLIRDAINGNSGLYFNGNSAMGPLTVSNALMTAGLSAQKAVFVTFNSYDLGFAMVEKGIFRINSTVNASLQQYLYNNFVQISYLGTGGPTSPAPANVFTQTEVNFSGPSANNSQGYVNGVAMAPSTRQVNFANAPVTLGTAQGSNTAVMNGLIGDMIIVDNMSLTQAQRGEINAYLAEKYRSVGSAVTTTSSVILNGLSVTLYDLSARNDTAIVDQFYVNTTTLANDIVRVSGADFVNTGAGDDTVYLDDLSFRQIDGGKGYDKLVLSNEYTGSSTLILADFVSNARGISGVTADDARVNAAGWHKLYGFEAIDLSMAAGKQLLTVTAADVNQLSETKALSVTLGSNDVIQPGAGFSSVTEVGVWTLNGSYYDRSWSGMANATAVTLYAKSGVFAPGLRSATLDTNTTVKVVMDQPVDSTSSVVTSNFNVDLGGGAVTAVTSTTASNLLSFTLSTAVSGGVLGLNYTPSGTGWMSNNGVVVGFTKWFIGDSSGNTMDRSSETTARMALMGNLGNDTIKGGAKSDLIVGGAGDDTLTGNGGGDIFRWDLGDMGTDTLSDFNTSKSIAGDVGTADRLDLRGLLSVSGLNDANLSTSLSNYLTLTQGGGVGVGAVPGTTLNDAVLTVDANNDGTVDQTIVLQLAWDINMASVRVNTVTGMTDVNGAPIGGSSNGIANSPSSSQMLHEMLNRGQLLVL